MIGLVHSLQVLRAHVAQGYEPGDHGDNRETDASALVTISTISMRCTYMHLYAACSYVYLDLIDVNRPRGNTSPRRSKSPSTPRRPCSRGPEPPRRLWTPPGPTSRWPPGRGCSRSIAPARPTLLYIHSIV